jgi:hypothetical protein
MVLPVTVFVFSVTVVVVVFTGSVGQPTQQAKSAATASTAMYDLIVRFPPAESVQSLHHDTAAQDARDHGLLLR